MNAVRLLVTRPEPDAARTAQLLRAQGHAVLIAPLLSFEPLMDAPLSGGPWAGILVTSANAIRALSEGQRAALRHLPALAVGARTTEAARAAGFANVESAAGDAADLAALAALRFPSAPAPLLYLAGEERAHDLAGMLAAWGIRVHEHVMYRMVAAERFPAAVRGALGGGIDGVLHFSRRTADAYLACADADRIRQAALRPAQYCLSEPIAAPLTRAGAATVRIAARPEEAALLRLIEHA